MLIDAKINKFHNSVSYIVCQSIANGNTEISKIHKGVYLINHFNFNNEIEDKIEQFPTLPFNLNDGRYLSSYGVIDSPQQFLELIIPILENAPDTYICSLTKIDKKSQPKGGGWRWHKWGAYYGVKNPQCEYIYDEDDSIQEVYVFSIYVKIPQN